MANLTENTRFLQLPENARARSLLKSMGYDAEDLKRPRIGIANSWGETSPGHIHLRGIADAVKAGVWQAGGTPFELNSPAQCPMAVGEPGMRFDLPTRDIIAAEVETIASIELFDAIVFISSCDKNVPAHLLAAARLDIPVIFIPGGPMSSVGCGISQKTISNLDTECYLFGVGTPRISEEELLALENSSCPGAGSCAILGTANTMQCLVEAMGLTLPSAATIPAVVAERLWIAKESGRRIVQMVREGLTSSRILTKGSLRNAIKALHALGGSTNAVAHLLALSYEKGWEKEINLEYIERASDEIPCITNVIPGGSYSLTDFHERGGVQAVLKALEPYLETEVPTVSGKPLKEQLKTVSFTPNEVIHSLEDPTFTHGLVILRGNLAISAIVRTPVIPKEMRFHEGPARIFDSQEEAIQALRSHRVKAGDVLVLRYEGPRGGPGFNEVFKVIGFLNALGLETKCALVTDGRISGFAKGPYICQVSPEAAVGGPLSLLKEGDLIRIDISNRRLDVLISEEEMDTRRKAWVPPPPRVKKGLLTLYYRLANPPEYGGGLDMRIG